MCLTKTTETLLDTVSLFSSPASPAAGYRVTNRGVQQTTNPKVSKTRSPLHGMMRRLMLASLLPALVAGEYDNCGRPDAVYASWDQVTRSLRAHHHAHAPNAHRQPCRVDRGTARLTLPALFRAARTSTSSAARALRPLTHRSLSEILTDHRVRGVAGLATCPWPPCTRPAPTRTTRGPSPRTIPSTR